MRWARKHPITAALTGLMVVGTVFMQLVYTTLSFGGFSMSPMSSLGFTWIGMAFAAWPAGFLATMAFLVRPRRRVLLGAVLYLLGTLGLPCLVLGVWGAGGLESVPDPIPGFPSILFVPVGLGVGVFLAALFGGMSRWISRRNQAEMLTVFYGGVAGAIPMTILFACVIMIPLMLFQGPVGVTLGATYLGEFIGSLVGFWLGGTFVARFVRHRLKANLSA